MKDLLKQAFEAGENRGAFTMREGDSRAYHSDYPDFETWYKKNCKALIGNFYTDKEIEEIKESEFDRGVYAGMGS